MYEVSYINWSDVVKNKITITKIDKTEIVKEANDVINRLKHNEKMTRWRQQNKQLINEYNKNYQQKDEYKEWDANYKNEKVSLTETRLDCIKKSKIRKVECPNCLVMYSANYMKRHLSKCNKGKNISYQDWKKELREKGDFLFKLPDFAKTDKDSPYIPIEQYNKEKKKVIII